MGAFIGALFGALHKVGLSFMKNIPVPLAKSTLVLLGLTATASAVEAGIHDKNLSFWNNNTSNVKQKDGRL